MATCGYDDDGVKTTQLAHHQGRHVRRLPDDARSGAPDRPEGVARLQLCRQLGVGPVPAHAERVAAARRARTSASRTSSRRPTTASTSRATAAISIDHQRYNFQFSGQTFWEVKNGKITTQLRDVAYQSNTPEFWKSLRHARRQVDLSAGRRVQRRQGPAGAEQLGQPRLPGRAVRASVNILNTGTVTLMIWTKEQAKALTDRALSFSKAEETQVVLTGGDRANVRFARNTRDDVGRVVRLQPGDHGQVRQAIRNGHRCRSSTTRACSARRGTREEIARLSPENPGGDAGARAADLRAGQARTSTTPRRRRRSGAPASVATAHRRSARRRRSCRRASSRPRRRSRRWRTRKGLFGYDRFTAADYNLTARTPDGSGSGWASKSFNELRLLRSGAARGDGHRQGGDGRRIRRPSSPASTPSSSSRRRWPI